MNLSNDVKEALACLKSEKRAKILKLLLYSEKGLRFHEISEELSIIPSTLEYHLRNLLDLNLISHFNNVYLKNGYLKLVWSIYKKLSELNPMIPFLKTHKMPFDDSGLFLKFMNSNPILLPDLISMLNLMKDLVKSKISKFKIAGSFNLELEEKIMRFNSDAIRMDELEIISTYQNFQKLLSYENRKYFFSLVAINHFNLFLVNRCNFYMGIGESMEETFGILFLPDLSDEIDFQKALMFRGKKNVGWLNDIFESLRKESKRISLTEGFIKDRALFSKYLEELNHE